MFPNVAYSYHQFGCGIKKMVGPKMQDFWPKIKGKKKSIDECQFIKKLSMILENIFFFKFAP